MKTDSPSGCPLKSVDYLKLSRSKLYAVAQEGEIRGSKVAR